jgi:basic amino acid/polyamine antiporter, APA family
LSLPSEKRPALVQGLGFWAAVSIVVGTVIGSGIFITPKAMIRHVGTPEMVLAVFVFGGILSLLGALTYAELAAAIPAAGGEYAYLRRAYGPFWGFVYGWTQVWVAKSGSIATLATGFFAYAANFVPGLERVITTIPLPIGPNWQPLEITYGQLFAIAVIVSLSFMNVFGVRFGGGVQVFLTVIKVALMVAIVGAAFALSPSFDGHFASSVPTQKGAVAGFFAALVAALWAYDGWNNVNMVASEVEQPQKNLPRALIAGVLIVVAIYVAMNIAYFLVLDASDVAQGDRVAVVMMKKLLGESGAAAVSIAVMLSIFAALNGSILSGSRVPFAMAADGLFFKKVGEVHPEYRTPAWAIALLCVVSSVLVLSGRYDELYTYVIFASWILYTMAAASVFVLRRKEPNLQRPYRTIGYPIVPLVFVVVALSLLLSTLVNSPRESILGLSLILLGIPFYRKWKKANNLVPDSGKN